MNKTPGITAHAPRKVCDALFARSKGYWTASLISKTGCVILGALLVIFFPRAAFSSIVVTAIYIASEFCIWRSDSFKSKAEQVLRRLDFKNSFGWEIPGSEMADMVMSLPARIRAGLPSDDNQDTYFAATEPQGASRAIANLQESSWWSKHIASRMSQICLWIIIGLVTLSITVLLMSIDAIDNASTLSEIGRVVTSALMVVFSLGLWRLAVGYHKFAQKAERIEQTSIALFKSGCDEFAAVRAWHDYQLARAASPLLPTWIWKCMADDLNRQWDIYILNNPPQCVGDNTVRQG